MSEGAIFEGSQENGTTPPPCNGSMVEWSNDGVTFMTSGFTWILLDLVIYRDSLFQRSLNTLRKYESMKKHIFKQGFKVVQLAAK